MPENLEDPGPRGDELVTAVDYRAAWAAWQKWNADLAALAAAREARRRERAAAKKRRQGATSQRN
ncbi:MAG TPA: hypothetical protein VKA46_00205 [Gemmataceae bacterium]|nr:hypothetical protein [Gemmataceae bacterium]